MKKNKTVPASMKKVYTQLSINIILNKHKSIKCNGDMMMDHKYPNRLYLDYNFFFKTKKQPLSLFLESF